VVDPPPLIDMVDSDEWEVDWILNSRFDCHCKGSGLPYLVERRGLDNTPDTMSWELPEHLAHAPNLAQEFHWAYPDKPAP